jgi:hypothetical protein
VEHIGFAKKAEPTQSTKAEMGVEQANTRQCEANASLLESEKGPGWREGKPVREIT